MKTSRFFLTQFEPGGDLPGGGSGSAPSDSGSAGSAASGPSSLPSNPWTSHTSDSNPDESRSASPTPDSVPPPASGRGTEAEAPKAPAVVPSGQPAVKPIAPVVQQPMTPEQMAQIAARSAAEVMRSQPQGQPQQQQAAPQFSQQEFNKAFNVPTVDASVFQAITGYAPDKPEQVTALQNFGQSLVRQAVTMATFQIEQTRRAVQEQFQPFVQQQNVAQDNAMKSEFFGKFSQLSEFQPLVLEIITGAQREGKRFDSKDEMYQFVADRAHTLLGKAVQPPMAQQPGTQQITTPSQASGSTRQMTPTSVGGQTSASSGSATRKTDAVSIFG